MSPADKTRYANLQQALTLLAALTIEAWTVDELAEALRCHTRTIYRYLDAFRQLGLPVIEEPTAGPRGSPRRGYRLGGIGRGPGAHWYGAWLRSQGIDPAEWRRRRGKRAANKRRRRGVTNEE